MEERKQLERRVNGIVTCSASAVFILFADVLLIWACLRNEMRRTELFLVYCGMYFEGNRHTGSLEFRFVPSLKAVIN